MSVIKSNISDAMFIRGSFLAVQANVIEKNVKRPSLTNIEAVNSAMTAITAEKNQVALFKRNIVTDADNISEVASSLQQSDSSSARQILHL